MDQKHNVEVANAEEEIILVFENASKNYSLTRRQLSVCELFLVTMQGDKHAKTIPCYWTPIKHTTPPLLQSAATVSMHDVLDLFVLYLKTRNGVALAKRDAPLETCAQYSLEHTFLVKKKPNFLLQILKKVDWERDLAKLLPNVFLARCLNEVQCLQYSK